MSDIENDTKFRTFWPPVKVWGGWARSLYQSLKLYLRPNLQNTFWWPSSVRLLIAVDWWKGNYMYSVNGKRDQNVLVISFKTLAILMKLVCRFLNKFAIKSLNVFHLTWIMSLHYPARSPLPNRRNIFDGHRLHRCWARCGVLIKTERKFMGKT